MGKTTPPAPAPLVVPPLHAAVWAGDLNRVRTLLDHARNSISASDQRDAFTSNNASTALKQLVETKDAHGNSALHLAVRLVHPAQRAIVQLLLEHDASVTSRNLDGWSCVHDATLCDDEFLLAQLFLRGEKQLLNLLESRQEPFFCALERLPDFEAEIFLEAHSWVPMVSKILPSDTIRLWKRGSQLRVDSALKGLDGIKWKRGRMSHMFMGRDSARPGHAVVVDHEGKTFYDVTTALGRPTTASIDLGLHMLLTTPLSTSTLDSSKMAFRKRKDVTAVKHTSKAASKCPWTGTKYKMESFAVAAQFRPVVKPERALRAATAADAPLEDIQQFVNHLSVHSSKADVAKSKRKARPTKDKSMRNTNFDSDDDLQEIECGRRTSSATAVKDPHRRNSSAATASDDRGDSARRVSKSSSSSSSTTGPSDTAGSSSSQTVLRLPKGKKVEMHLDVCAGDTIRWSFSSKSRDFCFTATYFHDDQKQPVCQTDGVKNVTVAGAFEADYTGSFVLMWLNTQKSFALDMSNSIKVLYEVAHIRPTLGLPAPSNSAAVGRRLPTAVEFDESQDVDDDDVNDSSSAENQESDKPSEPEPSDVERCQAFLRLDHIPNALTATTSFREYFAGPAAVAAFDAKKSASAKVSALFKRSNQQKKRSASDDEATNDDDDSVTGSERNTFRSLTVLPETRRLGKEFDAKVLMADRFPFALSDFLPVIQFLSHTGEHVKNLEDFFQMKLPPGFPVKFELPMMFTVRIAYTFERITLSDAIDAQLFEIPREYEQVFTLKEVRA